MTNEIQRLDERGIELRNMNDLAAAVQLIVASELCPMQFKNKPKDAMIAILAGRQVGWGPIQSLQYIAVINGRPSMFGDGPVGLAHSTGKVDWIREFWECGGKSCEEPNFASLNDYPNDFTACWQTKRKDNSEPSKVFRFSVGDAKTAGLWGKKGPWISYPKRMLVCRARAWGLRDTYSDALQGISQAEEWEDMTVHKEIDPLEAKVNRIIDVQPTETVIEKPTDSLIAQFQNRVAKHREKNSSMSDDAFIEHVCEVECGKPKLELLTKTEFDELGFALAAGKYDWETGEKIPESIKGEPQC